MIYNIFVGIFYPYKHFKSDCKLFGHPKFYQWGQIWCWKSAFSFLKWAFSTPYLTPLVKIGMTKLFTVTFKMFVWVKYAYKKIMYIIQIASLVFHYKYTYDLGWACVLCIIRNFWSKICVFVIKNQTSNPNDIHNVCVGIFYPYTHFKNDCKLFGHHNFYQWGQIWCWKCPFQERKCSFSTPYLTPLVKFGVAK